MTGVTPLVALMLGVFFGVYPARSAGVEADSPTLNGRWQSDCHQGKSAEMQIHEGHSRLRETFHQRSDCETRLFVLTTLGRLVFPESAETDAALAIFPVNYTYEEIYLTPLTAAMADYFSRIQLCDIRRWKERIPRRITGHGCRWVEGTKPTLVPSRGQKLYGIYAIHEPYLYFGQNNADEDSSSIERRPRQLQSQPFGRRLP